MITRRRIGIGIAVVGMGLLGGTLMQKFFPTIAPHHTIRVLVIKHDPQAHPLPLVMTPAQVVHRLGPWLARHTSLPVYLPAVSQFKSKPLYARALDVGYATLRRGGYHVALLLAPDTAVHSPATALKAQPAGQHYVAGLWVLPLTAPWHNLIPSLGTFTPPRTPKWKTIILSTSQVQVRPHLPGTETCWNIVYNRNMPVCQVVWHQNQWRIMAIAAAEPYAVGMPHYLTKDQRLALLQAQSDAQALNRPLPGQHGQAIIPFGVSSASSNSTASYELHGARYVIMAMHGDAAVMADHMQYITSSR